MQLLFKKDADKKHSIKFNEVTASGGKPEKPHSFYVIRDIMTPENGFPQGQSTTQLVVEVKGNA
jgi:hypothetical protein